MRLEQTVKLRNPGWVHAGLLAAFMVTAMVLTAPYLGSVQYYYEDSYTYLGLADSLSRGRYEIYGYPHNKYLPGYPAAVLAVHWISRAAAAVSHNPGPGIPYDTAGKLVSLTSRILVIPVVFYFALALAGFQAAFWAALLSTFHIYNILYGVLIYSDPLASLLITFALFRIAVKPKMGGAVTTGITAIVRPEAYLIVPARSLLLTGQVRNRNQWLRFGGFLTVVAIFVTPWYIRNKLVFTSTFGTSYLSEITHFRHSGISYLSNYGYVLWPAGILLFLLGAVRLVRMKPAWPLLSFLVMHTGLHIWWWWNDDRFIVQILPLLHVVCGAGMAGIMHRVEKKWYSILPPLILVAALIQQAWVSGIPMFRRETERSLTYMQAVESVNRFRDSAGVITADPGMVLHHSPHHPIGVWMHLQQSPQEFLFKSYCNDQARYLILCPAYPMDTRFLSLQIGDISSINILVRNGADYLQYELMIRKYKEFSGIRLEYQPDYSRLFSMRHPLMRQIGVELYLLECRRVPLMRGQQFEAVMIDRGDLERLPDEVPGEPAAR